jgi:hypothetical protein
LTGDLLVNYNSNLTSLQGLDGLASVGGYLDIRYNYKLNDFCALKEVSADGGITILDNAYNPTLSQIQSGACSY